MKKQNKKHLLPPLKHTICTPLEYLEPFFIGLFEGDGTITLARTRGNLSYGCFRIKLKYNPDNHHMLDCIRLNIGVRVRYVPRKKGNDQIEWVAQAQKDIKRITQIIKKYPLLTSRKILQLDHFKQCMVDRSWNCHLQTRDSKYLNQQKLIDHYKHNFRIPSYFGPWLSGFAEAEGCFFSTSKLSFSICQNYDWYIINAIKQYFNSHHQISIYKDKRPNRNPHHYRIYMTGKLVVERVIKHFSSNPLLGYKKINYHTFKNKFESRTALGQALVSW